MGDLAALKTVVESIAVELTAPECLVERAECTLSREERDRARRFQFPAVRRRYVLSHACLRRFLSIYVGANLRDCDFAVNEFGKPSIPGVHLQFNMSHSGEVAMYAFALHSTVGVDIEHLRPVADALQIAEHFFATQEWIDLKSTEPDRRAEAFFRCWTRKEAFIKAVGKGLSYPLHAFRVSLTPENPALVSVNGNTKAALEWSLREVHPAPGYIGCIAVQGLLREFRVLPMVSASRVLESEHAEIGLADDCRCR